MFGKKLSADQHARYANQGYLLVSALIRPSIVQAARQALMAGRPEGGADSLHAFSDNPAVIACFTKDVRSAAAQLTLKWKALPSPPTVYTITVLPSRSDWRWPAPHIDHSIERDAHRTIPPPFRVGCLIYLNDVPSRAGATVVWPRSHRTLAAAAAAYPDDYRYMSALNRDISKWALEPPVEVTAAAGDVLFYDYLCAHAGSANTASEPRVALNHKW
jgi:ectoine hydroxylase-related dioxygenase (phytanoyl-CoA dioxygenase family)